MPTHPAHAQLFTVSATTAQTSSSLLITHADKVISQRLDCGGSIASDDILAIVCNKNGLRGFADDHALLALYCSSRQQMLIQAMRWE